MLSNKQVFDNFDQAQTFTLILLHFLILYNQQEEKQKLSLMGKRKLTSSF